MRLSSSLPPAGFTRAEPSPPARRRALRAAWPLVAAVVLVLGAGLIAAGYAELRTAARTVTPDAATQSPPAKRPAPPAAPSEPRAAAPAAPSREPARHRGRPAPRSAPRSPAAPRRTAGPHRSRPRPAVKHKKRAARPAPPSWLASECRRRFPDDPLRKRYCVAAAVRGWQAARG
ncbi:hypothetical protein [Actinomadura sp. GTD37]|uniref:hypothetical protein n=1 Tax=Actinomadura sp. GTD37 TaxID=1778030 RepID=UPI0035BEF71D